MKKTTGTALRISSFVMILSGVFCVALDVMLVLYRFRDPEISRLAAFLGTLLLLFSAVLEIYTGIRGLSLLSAALRGGRLRVSTKRIRFLKRLTLTAIILGAAHVILSCVIGIIFWQLAALVISAVLVPLIHLLCIRSV